MPAPNTLTFELTTPFGGDKLQLRSIRGEERISGLFHYSLELVSRDKSLDFSRIVGKGVTVAMPLPGGGKAYLNGIAGRFVQGATDVRVTTYFADLYPALWLLTLASDCRIFQNMTAPEIVKKVLLEQGVAEVRDSLTGSYAQREFCVQYMETAFDFVSRLMEDEGIFYFFTHEEGKHTLVLADDSSAHPAVVSFDKVRMRPIEAAWEDEGSVLECSIEACAVTAKYQAGDYNFETPSTDLIASSSAEGSASIYEYPAGRKTKSDVESKTNAALQAIEAGRDLMRGRGSCRPFRAGARFTLEGHERSEFNAGYLIRQVTFHGEQSGPFSNSFECQPAGTPFRAPRKTSRPRISGSQTATVVGKQGEEIWTDRYGRVRLHFHWDRAGKRDDKDSCWVRVSQAWAGKQWGAFFLPRIGQEVVVSFLEGDPDRPIVTGSVYNAEQTLPYPLPGNQTRSAIKSNSSKGSGGFNEIRLEDKAGSEEFFIHAQKDYTAEILHDQKSTIGNDQTVTVKNNRKVTVQEKDETLVVSKGNRVVKVKTGNETHEVEGKRDVTVTGKESHTNNADYVMNVAGDFTLKVNGNISIEASGAVSIKSGTTLTNTAGSDLTNDANGNLTNSAGKSLTNKANMSMTNDGGISLTNKASASQIVDGGGMLTVKGGMVKMN